MNEYQGQVNALKQAEAEAKNRLKEAENAKTLALEALNASTKAKVELAVIE